MFTRCRRALHKRNACAHARAALVRIYNIYKKAHLSKTMRASCHGMFIVLGWTRARACRSKDERKCVGHGVVFDLSVGIKCERVSERERARV